MLGGVWLIYFCFGLTIAAMAPLVTPISAELEISHSAMGAILGAWPLVYIAAALPCGLLLDRLGLRLSLLLAALCIALSGLLRGLAGNEVELYLAVAVFGLGGPLISVGAPKLIATWFAGAERGLAMGLYITGPALGGICALALTNGLLMPLTGQDWRAVLFIYAGVTLLCGLVWLVIGQHPKARAGARPRGTDRGASSPLAAFRELVALKSVRLVLAMSIGIFFFNHGLNNWLPEILRSRGLSAAAAGYWAAIPTLVGIGGALLIPRLATPPRRLTIMLLLFLSAALASLLLQSDPGSALFSGLVLQGIARGSMMTIAILILMETPGLPSERMGMAGGLFFTAAEIGGVLGPLSVGLLSDMTGGFAAALGLMTAICLGLMLLLTALRRV